MICPEAYDWRQLTAHRFDPEEREPEGWAEAFTHLDRCDRCRSEALAADPTLLFQRLSAPPTLDTSAEVEAMRRAVTAMRRAERVETHAKGAADVHWGRFAAAAGVGLLALSLSSSAWLDHSGETPPKAAVNGRHPVAAVVFDPVAEQSVPPMPVYEWLDNPDSRIYQIAEDPEFTMVMIVSDKYENLGV